MQVTFNAYASTKVDIVTFGMFSKADANATFTLRDEFISTVFIVYDAWLTKTLKSVKVCISTLLFKVRSFVL